VEANCIHTDTVCIGEGLSAAFQQALAGLPSGNARVDHTICDMNGEPYRGNEFGFARLRSSGRFAAGSEFDTPADCWGDVGAASGPLFAILAAFAARKRYAPGPLTLLWASSQGGGRAAALLQAADNGPTEKT
jgi:3-oxoacyl-[acyl-carrier-protein] synthase-1